MPENSPPVLIIRLDAIGDALALTPLLAALRAHAIDVDLVLRPQNAAIFSSRAARRLYEAPFAQRSSAKENLAAIRAFARELRPNGYGSILVATEDPGGYRLAAAIGAPHRVGFINGWGKPLKTLWARSLLTQGIYRAAGLDPRAPHECEVLFSLARSLLGSTNPTRDPALLRRLVLDHDVAPDARIAMQITDKWERLGITFADVSALIRGASAQGPLRLVASRSESEYAERVRNALQMPIDYFDTLGPWKEAIAAARVLVAPDCGALHVAGMVGTPTVAVFPPIGAFALQSARWAPWAAPHTIIKADAGWTARALDALSRFYSVPQTTR